MGILAVVFLVVVLVEPFSRDRTLSLTLSVLGYLLWAAFVAEFAFRWWIAADRRRFLRRNWWRLIILAVPFLRLFALLRVLRVAGFAQLLSSAVRGSRSATQLLSGRLIRLGVFTAIVILVGTHLTYLSGSHPSYPRTLHDVTLTTIAGQPLNASSGVGQAVEVGLAAYSVLVFATLAGSIGAFFLDEQRGVDDRRDEPTGPSGSRPTTSGPGPADDDGTSSDTRRAG
ncbi:hypothetical protein O7626_08875 [Micromonospora sp. WMMD1102]|uniref:hypothetical protein n=1 Tax=Micromonospora sp. WMMD1102 TaxID=3016105 RepID=UPI0024151D86|nr:hypothetical protein [Micromonospora sp. WMMD1102]MDG4786036.1 hypothetical protein [Micromonospora sp. WMMD1102]